MCRPVQGPGDTAGNRTDMALSLGSSQYSEGQALRFERHYVQWLGAQSEARLPGFKSQLCY